MIKIMPNKTFLHTLFVILILIGFLSSTTSCTKQDNTSPISQQTLTKVSVRMKWFFAGTMTGWFAAKEEGFFKDAGIDINITPGGPDNNSVKLVAAGTDMFGVAGADEVLMSREKGIPIVAVGALFKDSPICFISKKKKNITSPVQWAGKTIEVSYGSNAEIQYRALVKKYNVKNIKEVPYTFNLIPFIEDKVDVSVAYKMDQVVTLQRQGIELNIITPKEHGINPYGDVIITTEKTLREQPELVRKFVQAALKGFIWSIGHQPQAIEYLVKNAPELKRDNEAQVFAATIPFLIADDNESLIGIMRKERWEATKKFMLDSGSLKQVKLEDAYRNNL